MPHMYILSRALPVFKGGDILPLHPRYYPSTPTPPHPLRLRPRTNTPTIHVGRWSLLAPSAFSSSFTAVIQRPSLHSNCAHAWRDRTGKHRERGGRCVGMHACEEGVSEGSAGSATTGVVANLGPGSVFCTWHEAARTTTIQLHMLLASQPSHRPVSHHSPKQLTCRLGTE